MQFSVLSRVIDLVIHLWVPIYSVLYLFISILHKIKYSSLPSSAISFDTGVLVFSRLWVTPSKSSASSAVLCAVSLGIIVRVSVTKVVVVVITSSKVGATPETLPSDGIVVFTSTVSVTTRASGVTVVVFVVVVFVGSGVLVWSGGVVFCSGVVFCWTSAILSSTMLWRLIEVISWTISRLCEEAGMVLSAESRFCICSLRSATGLSNDSSSSSSDFSTAFSSAEYLS